MTANPYASQLGDRDPFAVIRETPGALQALVEPLDDAERSRPMAPGKWSIDQVLCHLADCEIAFGFRMRQSLAQDNHVMQPFDQDAWAKPYGRLDGRQALATFQSLRGWNIAFLDGLSTEELARPTRHPERGAMTLRTIAETMAGHDRNHLERLQAALAA